MSLPANLWRWKLVNPPVSGALLIHRTEEGQLIGQVLQRREVTGFVKKGKDVEFRYTDWETVFLEDPDGIAVKAGIPL